MCLSSQKKAESERLIISNFFSFFMAYTFWEALWRTCAARMGDDVLKTRTLRGQEEDNTRHEQRGESIIVVHTRKTTCWNKTSTTNPNTPHPPIHTPTPDFTLLSYTRSLSRLVSTMRHSAKTRLKPPPAPKTGRNFCSKVNHRKEIKTRCRYFLPAYFPACPLFVPSHSHSHFWY